MTRLGDLGEIEVLRRLFGASAGAPPGPGGVGGAAGAVSLGPGDDAAVLRPRPGFDLVATTDTLVEGVHFRRDYIAAGPLGARLAEANLSDLAAMAAAPRWALVSMGVRREHEVDDLVAIQGGIADALSRAGAVIAGGNLVAVAGEEWLGLSLLGEVASGAAWTRAGARAGHHVVVTGFPGRAGAAARLAAAPASDARSVRFRPLVEAWLEPRARIELALELAQTGGVTAAIDLSDGFALDLARMCEASGVGAEIEGARWRADALLEEAARVLGLDAHALALGPSDDYELILAVDPMRGAACAEVARARDIPWQCVGTFTSARGTLEWLDAAGGRRALEPSGFDHFRAR